jgi:SAM-dependent methyltransferase
VLEKIDAERMRLLQQMIIKFGMDENHAFRYYRLAQIINDLNKRDILIIGCGKGFLEQLIVNYQSIVSLDIKPEEVEIAKKNNKGKKNIKFIAKDIFKFNSEQKFDLILASEIFEHLHDDKKLFIKINRLLKPDGTLILTIPNRMRLTNKFLYPLQKRIKYISDDHLREYTQKEITELLNQFNYRIMDIKGAYFRFIFEYSLRKRKLFKIDSNFRFFLENFFYSHLKNLNVYLIVISEPN